MTSKGTKWSKNEDGTGPATFHRDKPCVRCGSHEFLVSTKRCRPCNTRYGRQYLDTKDARDSHRGTPCAICSDPMEQPCYDEIDGTFRGWVCHSCNLIIGHAHDDAARLRKIADYVEAAVLAKAAQMRRPRRRKKA